MASHSETESQITTDRQTIENWATDADIVPARYTRHDSPHDLELRTESELGPNHEQISWDEFFSTLEDNDMVVVAHAADDYEVLEHDDALSRASVEDAELKEALMEGEVVTSTITETTVIERTIVEEAEIESQVVDREEVDASIENAQRRSRNVSCSVMDDGRQEHEQVSYDQFESGAHLSDELDIEVTADESWDLTRDVLERLTIESRIVDTDASETDTVEAENIDVQGIQQQILQSDLIDTEATPSEVIESGTVTTEFREGDVFETQVLEHKTIDEELSVQKRYTGTITDGETVAVETVSRTTVESDIVDEEGHSLDMGTTSTREEQAADTETTTEAHRLVPSQEDEGKTVVDSTGEEVGMVVEVENETLFVDPHPSLTDKIKAALDWGEPDEDTYPVTADQISDITDETVELSIKE